MRKYSNSFILLLCISALTACGFHLRGHIELPEQFSPLYVESKNLNSELLRDLKNLLRNNNIATATSRSGASTFIDIIDEKRSRRVLSVDSRGRVSEYELSLKIKYRLRGKNISEIDNALHLTRDLLFDPDTVLAIDYEQEVLYRDMNRDAARLILQKLTAVGKKVNQTVNSDDKQ